MFEHLKDYKRIIVTGNQRSGTRICTRMISEDTGHRFIDESELQNEERKYPDDLEKALDFFEMEENFVMQCPGLSYCAEKFSADDALVIWMVRPVEEIMASRARINWKFEGYELSKYGVAEGNIAIIKNERWMEQKKQIKNWIEIEYHSLSGHPLWVKNRKNWRVWQTSSLKSA